MPVLRLCDLRTGDETPFETSEIFVGRDPESSLVVSGLGSEVVSARHLRLSHSDGQWWIEDLGSSNGTFVNGHRVMPGSRVPLPHGAEIRLGESGPRFNVVEAAGRRVARTLVEQTPIADPGATAPTPGSDLQPPPSEPEGPHESKIKIKLHSTQTDEDFKVARSRIVIGRGPTCDVRWLREQDTIVSREHAEIALSADNKAILRDLGSRNGTLLNGHRLTEEQELHVGDRIELGRGGPEIVVEVLVLPGVTPASQPWSDKTAAKVAAVRDEKRRSFGGKGRTQFVQDVIEESSRKKSRFRSLFFVAALLVLVGGAAGGYWYIQVRGRESQAAVERTGAAGVADLPAADSIRSEARENIQRIRTELAEARRSSAPETVVDSLRAALDSATARTELLEATWARAQEDVSQQLADIDSKRREGERNMSRLQAEIDEAVTAQAAQETIDSLRRELETVTAETARVNDELNAVRGASLASVAQANQGAIGLVQVYLGETVRYASGFALTRSGYFLTNRQVMEGPAVPSDSVAAGTPSSLVRQLPDSVFVVMADEQTRRVATIVRIADAGGPDFAVLRITGYSGPPVIGVDWSGTGAARGEAAVLIGFPADQVIEPEETIRTSVNAGTFDEVTQQQVRFAGVSAMGSSGCPIFNANGIVVAVHRSEFDTERGVSVALPIHNVIPLLPPEAVQELRLNTNRG